MVHATLHKDLQRWKKSASWVTKLLDKEIKKERIRMCKAFIAIIAVTP
jgi:hypothetical protein